MRIRLHNVYKALCTETGGKYAPSEQQLLLSLFLFLIMQDQAAPVQKPTLKPRYSLILHNIASFSVPRSLTYVEYSLHFQTMPPLFI